MVQQTIPQPESRLTVAVQRVMAAIKESRANTELVRRLNAKLQEQFEAEVTAALAPMFEAQIKSAAERLRLLGDERKAWLEGKATQPALGLRLTSEGITSQIFDPREWNEELINRALPVIANGMSKAMRLQLRVMGIDTSSLKQMADRSMIKAFCPTGPGGGIDNSCGGPGGGSGDRTREVDVDNLYVEDIESAASDYYKPVGGKVDGRIVLSNVDNTNSISAEVDDPIVLKGIREVRMDEFESIRDRAGDVPARRANAAEQRRVEKLAEKIRESNSISPLIVVDDGHPAGPYILEGGHRFDALELLGAKSFPAVVVIDVDSVYDRASSGRLTDRLAPNEAVPTKSTKSTASEWLESYDDIGETLFETPMGQFNIIHATEYPQWMKQSIEDLLRESFSQDYWAKVNLTTLGDIDNFLITGLKEGWSIHQMAKEMAPNLLQEGAYATRRGKLIARTEAGHALNGSRSAAMDSLINDVGAELPMKKTWLSVLGTTTRDSHANLDGVPADKDGMWTLAGIKVRWPGDVVLPARERCNCFPGFVGVKGSFVGAQRVWYEGILTEIVTRRGVRLTVTPNHPITTSEGFVPAGQIKPSDQVVVYGTKADGLTSGDQEQYKPIAIEQVFETFAAGNRRTRSLSSRSGGVEILRSEVDDFYGDGLFCKGDINVVRTDWKLLEDGVFENGEKRGDSVFSFVNTKLLSESSFSSGGFPRDRINAASSGGMCLMEPSAGVLIGRVAPSGSLTVGVTTNFNASLYKSAMQDSTAVSSLLGQPLQGNAGFVELDEVVEIRNVEFSGHVYDVESDNGLVVAGDDPECNIGIVSSNCQCTITISYGMTDTEATTLLGEYQARLAEQGKNMLMTMQSVKGGPGSGNFGHMGNPPYVGGSGQGLAAAVDNEGKYIPGNIGGTLGVDTSKWKKDHPTAQKALQRIHKIEKLIFEEKWDELSKLQHTKDWFTSTAKSQNAYSQATLDAQAKAQSLLAKKLQGIPKDEKPIPAPAPPAIKPTLPANVIDPSNWNKIGGQLGTEKGGLYQNPETGKKYYVKVPDDPNRARNEVLAAKLYEMAGADVPGIHLTSMDGKLAVVSEWNDNLQKADWDGKSYHKQYAHTDFAVHAWLNNRDAVGAGSENPMDNIKWDPTDGKTVTVDVGGALDYKGMGGSGKKDFSFTASEWDSLRNPSVNPTMAKVFGDMTPYELKHSAGKLSKVTDEAINGLVDKYGNGSQMAKNQMKAVLKSRRDDIIDKANALNTPLVTTQIPKPGASNALPPKPTPSLSPKPSAPKPAAAPTKNTAVPPPPKAKPIQDKLNKIHEAAQSGDINAVMKSVKTKATNTSPYLQKLHAYKMSVIESMKNGGQTSPAHKAPPVPPQKIKIDPSAFPSKPSFASSQAANVAANNATVEKALGLAKNGDMVGLKSMDLPPSPKLKQWHESLVSQLHVQLNPPPPPKAISATYLEATKGLGNAKTAGTIKKIGYWHEVADLGGVPQGLPDGTWSTGKWTQGKATYNKFPSAVQEVLKSYTAGGYGPYNSMLREGKTSNSTYQKVADAAKTLITKGDNIQPGIMLSRKHGMDSSEVTLLKPGQVLSDKGFLSTSTKEGVWGGTVQWKMTVGHGVKGSYAKNYSYHSGENEVILPPNQRMLVTEVKKTDGITVVHATILPTEDSQCCPP